MYRMTPESAPNRVGVTGAAAGASNTRSPFVRLRELLGDTPPGQSPISLAVGEPQHPIPPFVGSVIAAHVAEFGRYPMNRGLEEFTAAVGQWLDRRYKLPRRVDPASEVLVLSGTREGLFLAGIAARNYAASRAKAGVKPALVHYYFPSMDDLFVAVLRDKAEHNLQRQREAIADAQPLHALWLLNSATDAQLFTEFLAMANHRKAIRSEISAYAMRFRDLEEGVVTLALKARGVDLEQFPPVVMSMIMGGLARMVMHEQGLGITHGHEEATAFIERCLDRFEMPVWDQATAQHSDPALSSGREVTSDTIA